MYLSNLLIAIGLTTGAKTRSSFLKENGLYSLQSKHRYRLPYGRITFPGERMAGVHIHADGFSKLSARGNIIDISRFARPFWWPQDVSFCKAALLHSFNEYLSKSEIDMDDFEYIRFPHILETEKHLEGRVSECVCRIKFGLKVGFLPFPFTDLGKTEADARSYCEDSISASPDSISEFERVDSIQYDMHSVAPLADPVRSWIPDMAVEIVKVNKDQAQHLKSPIDLMNGIPMSTVFEGFDNNSMDSDLNAFKTKVGSLLEKFSGTEEVQNLIQDYDGHGISYWWVYGGDGPDLIADIVPVLPVRDQHEYDEEQTYGTGGFGSVSPTDLPITEFGYNEPTFADCPKRIASMVRKGLETSGRSTKTVRTIRLELRILDPIRFIDQFRCILKSALMFGLGDLHITGSLVQSFEREEDIDGWIDERFKSYYNVYNRQWMPTVTLFRNCESVMDQITSPLENVAIQISRKHPQSRAADSHISVYNAIRDE